MSPRMATVGSVLKGIVSGKSLKTLERRPLGDEHGILKVSAVTWVSSAQARARPCPPTMSQEIAPDQCTATS